MSEKKQKRLEREQQIKNAPKHYRDPARNRKTHNLVLNRATAPAPVAARHPVPDAVDVGAGMGHIPRHARLGIMFVALQEGVPVTAARFGVPEATVYNWFKEEGGIQLIRDYVTASASVAFQRVIQSTCDELIKRMHQAKSEELFLSFRKMLEVGEKAGLVRASAGGAGEAGESGESENGPNPTHEELRPAIVLQFNQPGLPGPEAPKSDTKHPHPGSSEKANALDSPARDGIDPAQVIEGEARVIDVFDDA